MKIIFENKEAFKRGKNKIKEVTVSCEGELIFKAESDQIFVAVTEELGRMVNVTTIDSLDFKSLKALQLQFSQSVEEIEGGEEQDDFNSCVSDALSFVSEDIADKVVKMLAWEAQKRR